MNPHIASLTGVEFLVVCLSRELIAPLTVHLAGNMGRLGVRALMPEERAALADRPRLTLGLTIVPLYFTSTGELLGWNVFGVMQLVQAATIRGSQQPELEAITAQWATHAIIGVNQDPLAGCLDIIDNLTAQFDNTSASAIPDRSLIH